ncbi:MAG: GNAT family N-acetyltransferase [Sphingomicrobium sp.]|nr:GNAT family N-acetyltransferase [Sphingomonadales bacterium]
MSAVTYRDAAPPDADAVADLFVRSFVDTFGHLYPPHDLADFLATITADRFRQDIADPRFTFHLALADKQLAGYVKIGPPELPVETPPDTIELCQLYLLKEWHGTGIAAALMEWAMAEASAKGARYIQLSVYVDNHRARRFYERYGFAPVGRYDFMVGSHADEDIVLRHLVLQADR